MRFGVSRLLILSALTVLVGCDHVTKLAAKSELEGQAARPVVRGLVDLRYVENTDVAFNLLRSVPERTRGPTLLVAAGVGSLALVVLLLRRRGGLDLPGVALLLVTAGALGNGLDRAARGYVVDFIELPHWPVFNVADAYVVSGVVLLAAILWRGRRAATPAG